MFNLSTLVHLLDAVNSMFCVCVTLHFAETIFGGGDVAAGGCHTAGQRGDRGPMRCEGKSLVICPRICKSQSVVYYMLCWTHVRSAL